MSVLIDSTDMVQSETKFRGEWLKKKDGNGHLLEWWCETHESDKWRAIWKLCEKEIQVTSGGVHTLLQHASKNIHKQKATFHFASTHAKKDSEQQTTEQLSVPRSSGQSEMESLSFEVSEQGAKQASIKDFFIRTKSGDQPKTTEIEFKGSESSLTVQDQVLKAEILWALKTASDNIPSRTLDGIPELFQRMFVNSTIVQHMTMSRTKVSYMMGYGLEPHFLQMTVDDIPSSPYTFNTIHFDETTTVQVKKQMDVLVRYFSETNGEIEVRFLKALLFRHAFGEKVGDELLKTLEELGLPLKLLLSISSDGPNVNKKVKANINAKLKQYFKRQLVSTDSFQLHVVHNTFRKGLESYGGRH